MRPTITEVRLVQLCFDFYMIEAKPENLIGDRAYDSDPLDEELRRDGIEMIAPHSHRDHRSHKRHDLQQNETGGPGRCPMLGRIKYLRRVRVETDALKRNKDLASTRTPQLSPSMSGLRGMIWGMKPPKLPADFG